MRFGLSDETITQISSVFIQFPAIKKAVLYGSRAKGTFTTGSDIDLTLFGDALTLNVLGIIEDSLDELLLPYTIDLSLFDYLNHGPLKDHIQRVGIVFFESKSNQSLSTGE